MVIAPEPRRLYDMQENKLHGVREADENQNS